MATLLVRIDQPFYAPKGSRIFDPAYNAGRGGRTHKPEKRRHHSATHAETEHPSAAVNRRTSAAHGDDHERRHDEHRHTCAATDRRPGHLADGLDALRAQGEGTHPRRRRDRRSPPQAPDGRGGRRPRADRARRAVTLLDAFEGRRQLIAYFFMWWPGRPAPEQCEGCTLFISQVGELSYLHSRDITFAVFSQGRNTAFGPADAQTSYDESLRYRDFMGWDMPWYSAQPSLDTLLVGASSACSTSCATCGTATASSRPTGRTAAASRRWTTATRSWTSPCSDARNPGRTHPPAGHNAAP